MQLENGWSQTSLNKIKLNKIDQNKEGESGLFLV